MKNLIDLGFSHRTSKNVYHNVLCAKCGTIHSRYRTRKWARCPVCGPGNRTTHGHERKGKRSPTYSSWRSMRSRCNGTSQDPNYININHDPRWSKFESFLEDMGERPDGTTLDRIDVHGDYCKDNCRWVDWGIQANNRRNTIYWEWGGERLPLSVWAKVLEGHRTKYFKRMYTRGTCLRRGEE